MNGLISMTSSTLFMTLTPSLVEIEPFGSVTMRTFMRKKTSTYVCEWGCRVKLIKTRMEVNPWSRPV